MPPALKSALQAVIVNTMSNESGYDWSNDEVGLRFLVHAFCFTWTRNLRSAFSTRPVS